MKLTLGITGTLLLLLVLWYVEAEDFSESRVAGEYVFRHDNVEQCLWLHRDHTFAQVDHHSGEVVRAAGTWRVFTSTGHMAFSHEFLDARDAWRGQNSKEVYGVAKNYFGFVSISLGEITAFKKPFSAR